MDEGESASASSNSIARSGIGCRDAGLRVPTGGAAGPVSSGGTSRDVALSGAGAGFALLPGIAGGIAGLADWRADDSASDGALLATFFFDSSALRSASINRLMACLFLSSARH
jgi:hypothetical protein